MSLRDTLSNAIKPKKKNNNIEYYNEVGGSGTKINSGIISEEYNQELSGSRAFEKYDEMRKSDAQVQALLLAMELPIISTKRSIEPGCTNTEDGDDTTTDQDYIISQHVHDALFKKMKPGRSVFLRQALTMLPFGFSVFEKVYYEENGKIYVKKIAQRLARSVVTWEIDGIDPETGLKTKIPGIEQQLYNTATVGTYNPKIPMSKLVLFTFRQEGDNYEGVSVLRPVYKHRFLKNEFYKLDAIQKERTAIGIPVITLPKGSNAAEKLEAEIIGANLCGTEQSYVVKPSEDWKVEMLQMNANTNEHVDKAIDHHNNQIIKAGLAQFLDLGSASGSGSYALSEDQSSLFLQSLTSLANLICDVINEQLIKELVDLNFTLSENQSYPRLEFQKLGDTDYSKLATSLSTLVTGGLVQVDDDLEDYVRDTFGLPNKIETEDDMMDIEDSQDAAAGDEEAMLDDIEQKANGIEANDMVNGLLEFNEDDAQSYIFKAAMTQEQRDAISQGLIDYWKRKGKKTPAEISADKSNAQSRIDKQNSRMQNIKAQTDTKLAPIRSSIQSLRSELKSITGKNPAARQAVRDKIKALADQVKSITSDKKMVGAFAKAIRREALKDRKAAIAEMKARRQEVSQYIKQIYSDLRSDKSGKRAAIEGVRTRITSNMDQVKSLRDTLRGIKKGDPRRDAMREVIAGLLSENQTYRQAVSKISSDIQDATQATQAKAQKARDALKASEIEAKALEFGEQAKVSQYVANRIITELYNRNLDATDTNSVIRRLRDYIIETQLNKALDGVSDETIKIIIDKMVMDRNKRAVEEIKEEKPVELAQFTDEDAKNYGFNNVDDFVEFSETRKLFNFLDIINVQNQ